MSGRLMLATLLGVALALTAQSGAVARPPEEALPAQQVRLEPDTPDMALLRWRPEVGQHYRLCFSTNYAFLDFVACENAGSSGVWSVGAPRGDGATVYLTLQACRDGDCTEPVRAGAIGRRVENGLDFYATAQALDAGRVRVGGVLRFGAGALRHYRAAAGTAARLDAVCPELAAGEPCVGEMASRGALVGVALATDGAGERGVTLQVRETPRIALMFDDGTGIVSGGRYVMQSILDEYGVKGSFFLTGRAMQTYPAAVRALVAGGHRVGNHTWSHPFLTRLSDATVVRELDQTEAQFAAIIPGGTLRPCFRAPNGDFDARVLRVLRGRGYEQYTQTVSGLDYLGIPAGRIVDNVLAGARDGAIVSLHTQEPQTVIALRTLVPLLLAEGYQFVLVC